MSWSHKYEELFSLFEMSNYVQEFNEFDVDSLVGMFNEGWAERDSLRMRIENKATVLREKASALLDDVARIIREA